MRVRVCLVISILFGGALACSSSSTSGSPAVADASGDAFVCSDNTGGTALASIEDVYNKSFATGIGPGLLCPLDSSANPLPVSYDTALDTNCGTLGMKSGDVQYGECLGYLVREADLDSSGSNSPSASTTSRPTRSSGSSTATARRINAAWRRRPSRPAPFRAAASGLSSGGGGGMFEDCAPRPDSGLGGG